MTANSWSETDAAQSQGSTGVRYQYADDTSRVSDFDKDTGTDERMEVGGADRSDAWFQNGKRTYDLHQTLDTDAILASRKNSAKLDSMEIAEREQRLAHQAKVNSLEIAEREQRIRHADEANAQALRHYEDQHTIRYATSTGFWADTVQEAFAEKVADKVCERIRS